MRHWVSYDTHPRERIEAESDVSDAQQELDVIDDMEDAIELSHGLARRFLETTWGSTCDCDEQSPVEPEEPCVQPGSDGTVLANAGSAGCRWRLAAAAHVSREG